MVLRDVATTLVAALLAAICPVAGAPVFPIDGGNIFDRSINGLRRVMESQPAGNSAAVRQPHAPINADRYAHFQAQPDAYATPRSYVDMHMYSTPNSAAVQQPVYDQYGFDPPALADHSAQSQAWPGAFAAPHHFPDMHTWYNMPRGRHSQDELMDTNDVLDLFRDSDQSQQASPLRSTSTQTGQQPHAGSPAGADLGTFGGHFDDHMAGLHQSMDAQGYLLPTEPSPWHQSAGPSGPVPLQVSAEAKAVRLTTGSGMDGTKDAKHDYQLEIPSYATEEGLFRRMGMNAHEIRPATRVYPMQVATDEQRKAVSDIIKLRNGRHTHRKWKVPDLDKDRIKYIGVKTNFANRVWRNAGNLDGAKAFPPMLIDDSLVLFKKENKTGVYHAVAVPLAYKDGQLVFESEKRNVPLYMLGELPSM